MTLLNCFDSTVIRFTSSEEDGERQSQPHSGKYSLLGPDHMKHIRGWYIPIFQVVLLNLTLNGP